MTKIAPRVATTRLQMLNPLIPSPPMRLAIKPPTPPPTIPRTIFLIRPPSSFMIAFAITPANPPKIIHPNIPSYRFKIFMFIV